MIDVVDVKECEVVANPHPSQREFTEMTPSSSLKTGIDCGGGSDTAPAAHALDRPVNPSSSSPSGNGAEREHRKTIPIHSHVAFRVT